MKTKYILTLAEASVTLETVGGKGLSLAKLSASGFPVPGGFHIMTEAYRQFVEDNGLQVRIMAALKDMDISSPETLETTSGMIRGFFANAIIPPEVESSIREAYQNIQPENARVAVRSSATAEDLPGASFAGQQETYLNICGIEAVLDATKNCWASLWTARAIAYRFKNHIDQNSVALAVVVQEMVNAEASGVLFTTNPMNGARNEMVINAAWGLGEAIVGGVVTPDTIVADKITGAIKNLFVAEKTIITVATSTGTEERPLTDARRKAQVLKDAQVTELVNIARNIESLYGSPQDIEWCKVNGRYYILQSRPITTMPKVEVPPPSEWKLPKGAYAAVRNNIVELMAEPLSPLFATLGISAINASLHRLLNESFAMKGIMPPNIIVTVNQYAYNNGSLSAQGLFRVLFDAGKIMKKMFTGAVERWTESGRPRYYQVVESWRAKDWRSYTAVELVNSASLLTEAAIDAYGALVSGVIPAAWITEALFTNLYNRLIKRRNDAPAPAYLLGYDSIPIKADKSLYNLAKWTLENPYLADYLGQVATGQLLSSLERRGGVPENVPSVVWQEFRHRFYEHLRNYGHMLYDLDFANPVPADDPAPVLDALKLYLRGQGTNPNDRQRKMADRREQATCETRARLKGTRLKWFNKYLASAQKYAPLREDALAEIGLAYPIIRQMLHDLGRRFVSYQVIQAPEDIFWLTQDEVLQAANRLDAQGKVESLSDLIPQRRAEHRAALQARPPMALPQMKIFGFDLMSLKKKRGRGGKGNMIKGVAASPGKVTAAARILLGPGDFGQMKPGDVLVAPITTPAWTPLFAMASAVVTDVGGPLSHGSIVAREYGIPAVLGTEVATRRIQNGQVITVDGSAGTVDLKVE